MQALKIGSAIALALAFVVPAQAYQQYYEHQVRPTTIIGTVQGSVLGETSADDYGTGTTPTEGIYCPNLTRTMERGARDSTTGGQVTELQLFLADYFGLDEEDLVTGFFGRLTKSYVIKFQQEKGLPALGIVGALTRAAIAKACGSGSEGTATLSASPNSGPAPLTVYFQGTGSALHQSANISFGDGANSGEGVINTTHVYSTPGTYTATLHKDGAKAEIVARTTVTVTQGPAVPTPAASSTVLSATLDASTPGIQLVAGGSNALLGVFKVTNTATEGINIARIGLVIDDYNFHPADLVSVTLWDGATQLGTAVFIPSQVIPQGYHALVPLNASFIIPSNSSKTLTVRANIARVGTGESATSGHKIQIMPYYFLGTGTAQGQTYERNYRYTSGLPVSHPAYIYKSFPSVADDTLPSTGVADGRLMRFKIKSGSSPVSLAKLVFNVQASGATVSNGKLYAYTDSNYSQPAFTGETGGSVPTTAYGSTYMAFPGSPLSIPAGQVRYFEFRASVSGVAAGASVTTKLLSDQNLVPLQSGIVLREKDTNFVWSPNSTTTPSFSANDWTNGYAVPGLPASGLVFTRTGGGEPPSTNTIKVTAPNNREQWEIGQLNTITWAPYGYNPDVNPARDVTVELMTRNVDEFVSVGQIMDTGKASLHTYFNLNNHMTWAQPGQYYVRVTNNATGASDISDLPFTLLAPRVDLKINGSDGPVALSIGQRVTVSWKTRDTEQCRINGVKVDGYPEVNGYYVNMPSNGTLSGTYVGSENYSVRMVCTKYNAGEWGDTVWVQASQPPTPTTSASVQVISPNGGESLNKDSQLVVSAKSTGIKSASIALYKNDQWKTWLAKDVSTNTSADWPITFSFIPSNYIQGLGEGDNIGAIWKIYITGNKADGTGYADDKSDAPFTFKGTVPPQTNPVVINSFTSSASSVTPGQMITLNWSSNLSSTDISYWAGFCHISMLTTANEQIHVANNLGASGSVGYVPQASGTYTLRCSSGAKDGDPMAQKTLTVTVNAPTVAQPSITNFTASPNYITTRSGSTYLSWTTTNANRCVLKYDAQEVSVNPNGSTTLFPPATTTYTLWCANDPGTGKDGPATSKSLTVYVDRPIVDPTGYYEP